MRLHGAGSSSWSRQIPRRCRCYAAAGGGGDAGASPPSRRRTRASSRRTHTTAAPQSPPQSPLSAAQTLPRVLLLHTGGTLGMDASASFEPPDAGHPESVQLRPGTGGVYPLRPGDMLGRLLEVVPELKLFADLDLQVVFNRDSSRVGPKEWQQLARLLHASRAAYDAFVVIHGTDTMAFSASAVSLMIAGFGKPVVFTGSQLPLASPRSDARQNLIDSITCATAAARAAPPTTSPPQGAHGGNDGGGAGGSGGTTWAPPPPPLREVGICFGGKLTRGNRTRKVYSSRYAAFDSPGHPPLARLGVDVEWNAAALLAVPEGAAYRPRFRLNPAVLRIPIVPGSDPRLAYGDLAGRGVRGVILEAFGVGNFPDLPQQGWVPWLKDQVKQGLVVHLASQCPGPLRPELYRSGAAALSLGVGAQAGPQMTPECAAVKLMLCIEHPDLALNVPLAGEL